MAEVIRYVDTDVSGGDGDGTSWANAYASLSAWNTAEQTNLVTAGNIHHVYCRASSGSDDTTVVTIDGWTTNSTNKIIIEAASSDYAEKTGFDASKYFYTDARILVRGSASYVDFVGIQFGAVSYSNVVSCSLSFGSGAVHFKDCIFYSDATASEDIKITAMTSVTVENCIFYGDEGTEDYAIQCLSSECAVNIYNCVIKNRSTGVYITGGTVDIKNTAIMDCADDINDNSGGSATVTIDYCASDDGDGTHAVAPSDSDWDNEFADPANGDFTLLNTGNLYDAGVGPSSDANVPTTDIDGDTRSGATCDIGVDEYVAAGGISIPVVMHHLNMMRQ
jgi:hypothetical protein